MLYRVGELGDHSFGEGTVNWNDWSEVLVNDVIAVSCPLSYTTI